MTVADPPLAAGRDKLIDGFRALAVLAVIAGHAMAYRFSSIIEADRVGHQIARLASPLADTGVFVFFTISGYIITSLMTREERTKGKFSLIAFYVRRALRILPPFLIYLIALAVAVSTNVIRFDLTEIPASAFFTCNTGLTRCSWFVAHTWSLAVEEQFYLFWPLLFTLIPPRFRSRFSTMTCVMLVGVFLIRPWDWHSNLISFACISAGVTCALSSRFTATLTRLGHAGGLFAAAIILLMGPFVLGSKLVEAATPLLAVYLLFGARNSGLARYILESGPLQFIGRISYSLYLWQQLFLGAPEQYLIPPAVVMLPIVAWLSFRYIERPAMHLSHRLSRRIVEGNAARSDLKSA